MGYVELHCHSAYSFLDGASQPEELAARAADLGYEALALTDHDGVYGSLEFAHAAKAFGVRPITGAEVTLAGGAHVTLLVETPKGYANLCRCSPRRTPAPPKEGAEPLPPELPLESLLERTTGSSASPAARARLWASRPERRRPVAPRSADRFYVELQRPYERGDARRNAPCASSPATSAWHRRHRRTSTATTRARRAQDALVAIRCRTLARRLRAGGAATTRRPARSRRVSTASRDDARRAPHGSPPAYRST
jgi:error-prone DNA polymerase